MKTIDKEIRNLRIKLALYILSGIMQVGSLAYGWIKFGWVFPALLATFAVGYYITLKLK